MIELSRLELKNFLSHVDTSLPLEEYKGLILVEGGNTSGYYSSNGSGKSTLLEGIVYALTGDTLRGVSVNDVINRNYKKNTRVSLSFKKEGTPYEVSRYRKDDIRGDSLLLHRGEEDISKRVNKDTQKSLEDILDISYRILVSTILLGEGLSSRFTQLSDPEKKSLIESTLNLQYDISAIRAKANSSLSQLKLDKSNLEGRLSTLRELSSLDVEEEKRLLSEEEAEEAKASDEIQRLQSSLEGMRESRTSLEKKINTLMVSINQYDQYLSLLDRLNSELSRCKIELESIGLDNRTPSNIPVCSLCRQALVSQESRESVRSNYEERIAQLGSEILDTSKKMQALPLKDILDSTYARLCEERDSIDTQMTEYQTSLNSLSSHYWTLKSSIGIRRDTIKRYEESNADISSLEKEEKVLSRNITKYEYFYKLFSPTGIVVDILTDAINYINERLSTYSEVLLEKDYRINFLKGKISLVDSTGASYQSLSNGEKRRLDIAIQFSLHDYCMKYCGAGVDTMFIDEILDTLDDIGIKNIITVLRLKLDYCNLSRIFVISHNSELKSYFDKVITVVKDENGDSRVKF